MIRNSSAEQITEALVRFDRDHRDQADWADWTQNRSHKYAIQSDDKLYPVKFVISLATGQPTSEFSGGDKPGQAAHYVAERGFEIVRLHGRNPTWTRDELILALDLYLRFRESPPSKNSDEILLRYAHLAGEHLKQAAGHIEGTVLAHSDDQRRLRVIVSN